MSNSSLSKPNRPCKRILVRIVSAKCNATASSNSINPFSKQRPDKRLLTAMKKLSAFLFAALVAAGASAQKQNTLILIRGGNFKNAKCTNYFGKGLTVPDFYIGKFEVTQKEWTEVMGNNPSQFKGDNLP